MELLRALAALGAPPGPELAPVAAALELGELPAARDHTDLFTFQLYPYASVYLGPEGMLGGEARDRVAGFWRVLRLVPPSEADHLSALLGLFVWLAEEEVAGSRAARKARGALAWEHLLPWLPPYLVRVAELSPGFYAAWARLLQEALAASCVDLAVPSQLPLHLRAAPSLPDPRQEGWGALTDALLSPVRSGLILTRQDLADCARETGSGGRMGGRRFMLSSLLTQDQTATLRWLASEARLWVGRHRVCGAPPGIAGFWESRAHASAALLVDLARERPVLM